MSHGSSILCKGDAAASRTYSSTPVTESHATVPYISFASTHLVTLYGSASHSRTWLVVYNFLEDIRGSLSMFTPASGSGFITAAASMKYKMFKTINTTQVYFPQQTMPSTSRTSRVGCRVPQMPSTQSSVKTWWMHNRLRRVALRPWRR